MQLSSRDTADLLRSVGGLLFAIGAVVLLARKSEHHQWGEFARFLTVFVPAAVLYVLALGRPERTQGQSPRPWQSVLMVTAILLVPVAFFELLAWLGANTRNVLWSAGAFAFTALLAGYGVRRARVSYSALLAGLSLLVAWLLIWDKVIDHPSANTLRWLLVIAAALLLAAAWALTRAGAIGASEVATVGGIAAVAAGILGVVVGAVVGVARIATSAISGGAGSRSVVAIHTNGVQHFGWDLYLLIVSLALVWMGSRVRVRGLGYVGGFGLLAFLVSVSAQIVRIESGRAPNGEVGWPLALLIIGAVGLAAPALYRRES